MATAIHHGPPGSYKSFTLVQRFAIPALTEGRVVVTNIRGFDSIERVKDQFDDMTFPNSAYILWVDTTTGEGRRLMAQWWHWVPFRALIIIDEVQQIYPDRRDFKLESLDNFTPPPGLHIEDLSQYGIPEGRPEDVFTAFDKQRHYNWDIYCSTPNIAKVKTEIRQVTEWAYRHRDISGLLPWYKHRWIEHQHDPENNGKSASQRAGSPTHYQADPRIFNCYASTATGEHVQSTAGRKILQDPKLLALLGLIGVCIVISTSIFMHRQSTKDSQLVASQTPSQPAAKTEHHANSDVVYGKTRQTNTHSDAAVSDEVINQEPLSYVDRKHALKWSIYGIKRDELFKVPTTCTISKNTVKCAVPKDISLLHAGVNHICYPHLNATLCLMMFAIDLPKELPQPQVEPKDKQTLLASSVKLDHIAGNVVNSAASALPDAE